MTKRPFIKALLIDISGNLHIGSTPTPNAVEAIRRLREAKIPFRLCSNASKESTSILVLKLNAMGFEFAIGTGQGGRKEVWTSIGSVAQFVKDRGFKRPYLLLSDSAREEVFPQEAANPVPHDAVVVGLASGLFDYAHLNTAFRILKGEEDGSGRTVPLIATHKAKYIERDDPQGLSLGPGPFVTALEEAAGCKAHVVGKPTKTFFELVTNDFLPSELPEDGRIAVIGDDVEADLGGGSVELGLWRVLVKTGKYRPGDETRPGAVPPDEVYENFAAFVDHLLSANDPAKALQEDRCSLM